MEPVFVYQDPFPLGKDDTRYRKLEGAFVKTSRFEGREMLVVDPKALEALAAQAFKDVSFLLRSRHLEQLASILKDPEASRNDKAVALELLKNPVIAARFALPSCQDTGTAIVMGKTGQQVWTGADDSEHLSKGIWNTYTQDNLRDSQCVPLTMYEARNSGDKSPAQIDLYSHPGAERVPLHRQGGSH